jgi:hypothetical protein
VGTNESAWDVLYVATNLWARYTLDSFRQDATTNRIPAVTSLCSLVTAPIGSWTNSTRAWTNAYLSPVMADAPLATAAGWWGTNYCTGVQIWATSQGTNVYTNTVTTTLVRVSRPIQTNLPMQTVDVWSLDAYRAMRERWAAVGWTLLAETNASAAGSDYFREGGQPRAEWFRYARTNLQAVKTALKTLAPSYVDYRQADPDGSLDTWFRTNRVREFDSGLVIGATTGNWHLVPVDEPPYMNATLILQRLSLPCDWGPPETQTWYTYGWEAGSNNTYQFDDPSDLRVTTNIYSNAVRTWWDWTPSKAIGAAGIGITGFSRFVWRFPYPGTSTNTLYSTCTNCHTYRAAQWAEGGTGRIVVTDADCAGTTALVASLYYTNSAVQTVAWWCADAYIASNATDLQYGFAYLSNVIGELRWTWRQLAPVSDLSTATNRYLFTADTNTLGRAEATICQTSDLATACSDATAAWAPDGTVTGAWPRVIEETEEVSALDTASVAVTDSNDWAYWRYDFEIGNGGECAEPREYDFWVTMLQGTNFLIQEEGTNGLCSDYPIPSGDGSCTPCSVGESQTVCSLRFTYTQLTDPIPWRNDGCWWCPVDYFTNWCATSAAPPAVDAFVFSWTKQLRDSAILWSTAETWTNLPSDRDIYVWPATLDCYTNSVAEDGNAYSAADGLQRYTIQPAQRTPRVWVTNWANGGQPYAGACADATRQAFGLTNAGALLKWSFDY